MYSFFLYIKKKEQKEGLSAFKLVIFKLDSSKFNSQDALILEQYFLLDPSFNLNTSRVVNAPNPNTKEIFMYNKDKTLLIYHSKVMKDFMTKFGINNKVITNNLKNGSFYLGKYVFSSVPILTAKKG